MSNTIIKKIVGFILVFSMFLAILPAYSQNRNKITLKMEDAPLEKILDNIERQTNYLFLCEKVDLNEKKSISVEDKTLEELLSILFKGTSVVWRISDSNVYLSVKDKTQPLNNKATGTVIDVFGQPVIGVGVLIKGTTIGASTDMDGKFAFELPESPASDILEFTCLGYKSKEIRIGNRRVFNITMEDESIVMEGTVVTALGIKRSEKALSYNVQEISSDDIVSNKDANFINSLAILAQYNTPYCVVDENDPEPHEYVHTCELREQHRRSRHKDDSDKHKQDN